MNKHFATAIFILLSLAACAQNPPAYTADKLMARISSHPDTTYIVNFWATWCAPCVAELPGFDSLQNQYAGQPIKVLLVSFDFKEAYPKKLVDFIKRKNLKPEVLWFSETDAESFVPKIDKGWSGSLPSTMVANARTKAHLFLDRPVISAEVSALVAKAQQ